MAQPDVRELAAQVVHEVRRQGRSLSAALPGAERTIDAAMWPLLRELCYGSLRYAPRLDVWLGLLLTHPLRKRDAWVGDLILVALYELFFLHTPDYAVVSETVRVARGLKQPWAGKLVNAVLRNARRREAELLALAQTDEIARYAHPQWLLAQLREDWPDDWPQICAANNARAPMTLRVNTRRGTVASYLERLATAGVAARKVPTVPTAVMLDKAVDVADLPGFADGDVSVQDAAAQLAAELLDAAPGHRVLDACAAPGGKTAHILERAGHALELSAVEKDAQRMQRVAETLRRLNLDACLVTADLAQLDAWWNGQPFDRILLDAPCSATGVIRRHPDIKSLRRDADIASLSRQQQQLLDVAWRVLAPGGRLVYATCSILRAENALNIRRFLARQPDARESLIDARWGRAESHGRQILPGEDGMDGFYYACLSKQPA
ncbi:16S rRNA (cytosine(967)-C(5))-methyltransferase RsmB [Acidihalobacter ferrooxydans]|uniref:16S rRNA (cytosine(967)-C(5))-methyltransferase n=1 Tax=Acidihalobacter ferrooxydans TaxID=1765967 RepID=A0A1P8UKQ0_9GAMM|nr:16S rRNA (cytosine(967)-C(5))-methyltransferase RsmB [Acidihalobacter ferrooxydans]APZ44375.1 16S rRNA (cytosine(967)-C(5))-methyltransferase [Acidihalobacter ferrooxydans]